MSEKQGGGQWLASEIFVSGAWYTELPRGGAKGSPIFGVLGPTLRLRQAQVNRKTGPNLSPESSSEETDCPFGHVAAGEHAESRVQ